VWGVDADREGIDALRRQGVKNLYCGDLENLDSLPVDRTFDLIIAGEVIEHLSNPGALLRGVQRFMAPDSRLVVTTVNSYCAFRFAIYGLRGRGGAAEPVHPDHVAYYSHNTLRHIAYRAGLSMQDFKFYDVGTEHRPFMRASVRWINDVTVHIMPHLADGVIGIFSRSGEHKS
jgi:SAM-dependent methyltransferase